jgi:hypothetical protein
MAANPVATRRRVDRVVPLRVAGVQRDSDTTISFVLRPLNEQAPTPSSAAGQYLTLRLQPDGESGLRVIRSYSMSRTRRTLIRYPSLPATLGQSRDAPFGSATGSVALSSGR